MSIRYSSYPINYYFPPLTVPIKKGVIILSLRCLEYTCCFVFIRLCHKKSRAKSVKQWQWIFKPIYIHITKQYIVTKLQYRQNHSGLYFGHPLKAFCSEVAIIEADVTWS